jgi:hypothetical protein
LRFSGRQENRQAFWARSRFLGRSKQYHGHCYSVSQT